MDYKFSNYFRLPGAAKCELRAYTNVRC